MYNVDVIQKCIKIVLNLNLLFIIVRRVSSSGGDKVAIKQAVLARY